MTGEIVTAWEDATTAYLVLRVDEGERLTDEDGTEQPVYVEYIGSVPLAEVTGKTTAQKRSALIAATKEVRRQALAVRQPLAYSGTVNL